MKRTFTIAIFLLPGLSACAQLYSSLGLNLPGKTLSNLAAEGPSFGVGYQHVLNERFALVASSSFVFFHSKHYPDYRPVGVVRTVDFRVDVLPLLFGATFHPFNGRFTKKLFLSGKVGGQWIFFKYHAIGIQESTYFVSRELDFSYNYELGLDLTVCQFLLSNTFVDSRSDYLVNKVSYVTVSVNIKILNDFSWRPKR